MIHLADINYTEQKSSESRREETNYACVSQIIGG
jgi:hypothetical protein